MSVLTTTHGYYNKPIYRLWKGIIKRCECKTEKNYKWYGERGILMDRAWRHNPKAFCDWAMANGYARGLEIDRINTNGNYSPDNCRFVTHRENCAPNKRRLRSTNKSGERNICITKYNRYEAYAHINGKQKYIGAFKTISDAVIARNAAEEATT